MAINFDRALGIHERALQLRTQRAEVLATNLANAETPNFKARDIDFQSVLEKEMDNKSGGGLHMQTTTAGHIPLQAGNYADPELKYRIPDQMSLDGNTVEAHHEHAKFMENSMDFQASFTLLNKKFTGLTKALKGE